MKKRFLITALVLLLTLSFMSVTAYAGGGDCTEPPLPVETPAPEPAPEIPATEAEPEKKPFTPAGTGTVIDNATDGDGKEFFTIMTPAENVFYLIIDRQRETENVYFLNAVTEADLLALAVIPEKPAPEVVEPAPPTEPEPEPEPQKSGGGGMILVVVLVLLGGGAGWYFKIYRPKQQQADTENDFEYSEETELYGENDLYGEEDDSGDYDGYGGDPDDSGEWKDGADLEDDAPWDDE